jgi:hypothetical protein
MKEGEHPFYTGANGDTWSFVRDGHTETITIKHQPNTSSGCQQSLTTLQNFLTGEHSPQHDALIQLLRTSLHKVFDLQSSLSARSGAWQLRLHQDR